MTAYFRNHSLLAMLTALLLMLPALPAQAQTVDPAPAQALYWPLDVATVDIDVASVNDLFGLGAELTYDATRATLNDASLTAASTDLDDGTLLSPFVNDDDNGLVAFSVTRSGAGGFTGAGTAATMTFNVIDFAPPGTASLSLADILAVNAAGSQITLSTTGASFEVGGVWPGDLDNNCTVQIVDLFAIVGNFGDTGPARQGGFDISWGAKAFSPWGGSSSHADFSDSFVDGTGNGVINQNDILTIGVNFGQTHAATTGCTPAAAPKTIKRYTLALAPQPVGSVIEVELASAEAVDALLGTSFEISVDASVLRVVSARAGSLIDDGDLLELVHLGESGGTGAAAFSRKHREQATSGSGALAVVTLEVVGAMEVPSVVTVSDVNYNTPDGIVAAAARLSSATALAEVAEVPLSFALSGNYPNPFNPETTLRFEVPAAAHVKLAVYDVLGREVRVLVDGIREAGRHEVTFEAAGLPSGMYLYRLETPQGSFTKTMQLIK